MTEQCRAVLQECDFPESDCRAMEKVLCKYSPARIMNLVWSKDPGGEHDFEWFAPFFKGYLKQVVFLDPEPDWSEQFWSAYDIACDSFECMSTFDLAHVQVMSSDIPRMRRAISQATIKKAAYVRKIWEGMPKVQIPEKTIIDFEIKPASGVKVREL